MQGHQTKPNKNPLTLITIKVYSLEYKERYNILVGKEKYTIYVLHQVRKDFLPCRLIQLVHVCSSNYVFNIVFS